MDELERLRALKPKRPPSKQRKVDLWLDEIKRKQREDGATLEEIATVLFPEIKPATFRVMVRRAMKKREKLARPASPSASAEQPRKRGDSAPASPETAPAKPAPERSLTKRSRGERASPPARSAQDGEGWALSPEEKTRCTDSRGNLLPPQDDRIPPPWSELPVTEKDLPGDLPNRGILAQCETWLEVHFYLSTFKGSKNPFMGQEPNLITLKKLLEKRFPEEKDYARALKRKRDRGLEM